MDKSMDETSRHNIKSFARIAIGGLLIVIIYFFAYNRLTEKYSDNIEHERKSRLTHLVILARNTIEPIVSRVRTGTLSRDEGLQQVRDLTRRMIYRDDYGENYIFMSAYDGTMLVQPFEPHKELTMQWDLRDIHGVYIIRELIRTARSSTSGGFVRYHYYPPNAQSPQEKLAFVLGIPELQCYIGTGMYMQQAHREQHAILRRAQIFSFLLLTLFLVPVLVSLRELIRRNNQLAFEARVRIQAENAQKETSELLQAIIESMPNPVFFKDENGLYRGCNRMFADFIGRSKHEIIGAKVFEVAQPDLANIYFLKDKELFENPGIQIYESSIMTEAFGKRDVIINKATFNIQGKLAGIVGVVLDITERKKQEELIKLSEERFRAVSDMANDYIYYARVNHDGSFKVEWRYGNIERIYGYSDDEIMSLGGPAHLIHSDDYTIIMANYPKLLSNEKVVNIYRVYDKTGNIKWLRNYLKPEWSDSESRVTGFYSAIQDITSQKEAEQIINESLREKETLIKEIHHRVKNNMQVIVSLLSLQGRKAASAELTRYLEESRNRVRAMALIHEKLYQSTDLSKIDFSGYLRTIAQELQRSYSDFSSGVDIQYKLESVFLPIDRAIPCGLIVNELLSNAFKHAFKGSIDREKTIMISLSADTSGNVVIIIADNGHGIPEDVDIDTTPSLGLSLVPMLAKQIKGDISLDRRSGTTFTISFPLPI
jgi:PAS domain S-box-containing protein